MRPGKVGEERICLGLTGPNAAGKGEIARFLSEAGFGYFSLSDSVREEATLQGLDHSRDNLIRTGTWLREKFGPGVLAERILVRLTPRSVVDSIRNPGEIEVLRRLPRFFLLGVDAPQELRFERSLARSRGGDGLTLESFRSKEQKEQAKDGPGQQLQICLALADRVVQNLGTLEELRDKVTSVLAEKGINLS